VIPWSRKRISDESFRGVSVARTAGQEAITGGELLRRSREQGPHFSAEELDRIERLKADDRPPEDKWQP
jgi:hypothetical protein